MAAAFLLPSLYFGSLGTALLIVIVRWSIFQRNFTAQLVTRRPLVLCAAALPFSLAAFYLTWTLIFSFFGEYLTRYGCPNHPLSLFTCQEEAWLTESAGDTFIEAYVRVSDNWQGWFWSSQLLVWVVPGCLWLYVESTRLGLGKIHQLAFLTLGFFGAISLAFPLAFSDITLRQISHQKQQARSERRQPIIGFWVYLSSVLALLSAVVLPHTVHTDRTLYIVALAALHVVLILPTLFGGPDRSGGRAGEQQRLQLKLGFLYAALCGVAAASHIHNAAQILFSEKSVLDIESLQGLLWSTVRTSYNNSCQSSISWDVQLTNISALAYAAFRNRSGLWGFLTLLALSPLISTGGVFSGVMAWCELSGLLNRPHNDKGE